mmetsp:Transcript_131478/g.327882  ORF Transcript_131478/g.327882 Transcript_131478/m.327882 type:complete len:565 (-) Transcript_131478:74-1768(-)
MALQILGAEGAGSQGAALSISAEASRDYVWSVLAQSGDEEKASTIRELAQRGEAEVASYVDVIVELLNDVHAPKVRAAVCQAVRASGKVGALYAQDLTSLLSEQDPEVRYQACLALAGMGDAAAGALTKLKQLLGDRSEIVRYGACAALGGLEAAACADDIAALLSDNSPEVQGAACWALGKLGRSAQSSAAGVFKRLAEPRSRLQALKAVAMMRPAGDAQSWEDVCGCLKDEDAETRMAAVFAIGEMASAVKDSGPAYSKLTGVLNADDGRFRCAAALALGLLGSRAGDQIDNLKDLLSDEFSEPPTDALSAGGCRPRLPAQWRNAKCAAAVALGHIVSCDGGGCDGSGLAASVAELLNDNTWEVRLAACEALGMMGTWAQGEASQVATLLEDPRFQVRAKAAATCAKLGDSQVISKLVDMLEDASPAVREEVVRALPRFNSESQEYMEKLSEKLVDPVVSVRVAVIEVLAALGAPRSGYYASAVAQRLSAEGEAASVQVAALQALGKMGKRGALYQDLLNEYAQSTLPQLRQAAEQGLSSMRSLQGGQPYMIESFNEGDGGE